MFSPTTMASSTTMPSDTMNANSEIMFSDTPNWGRAQNAPRKLMAMPRLTHSASRNCSVSARHRNTRIRPATPFFSSRSMRLL